MDGGGRPDRPGGGDSLRPSGQGRGGSGPGLPSGIQGILPDRTGDWPGRWMDLTKLH